MIVVSYVTQPPSLDQIKGLTFGTVSKEQRRQYKESVRPMGVFRVRNVPSALYKALGGGWN